MANIRPVLTIETKCDGKCCDPNCSQFGEGIYNVACSALGIVIERDEELQGWKRPEKCIDLEEEYDCGK